MPSDPTDPGIPNSLTRRLKTMGHGLLKLSEARQLLTVRLERGLLDEASTAWIKTWCEGTETALPLPIDSELQTEVAWSGKSWQIVRVAGSEGDLAWLRVLMLLHLPVLRSFWRRALRAQRFAWLSRALPKVWAVDVQPVKPGSVIADLGITAWHDLPKVLQAGRSFEAITLKTGVVHHVDAATWSAILSEAKLGELWLKETFSLDLEGTVNAGWRRNEAGRIVAA